MKGRGPAALVAASDDALVRMRMLPALALPLLVAALIAGTGGAEGQGTACPAGAIADGKGPPACFTPKDSFRDCPDLCPELIVLPAGSFRMGSPADEVARFDDEGPAHRVRIAPFAMGRTEVTRGQFAAFVAATGYRVAESCFTNDGVAYTKAAGKSFRDPDFGQDDGHPAVCVRWEDAKAYAAWLSALTGKDYRLPSEAEWEYAARAGTDRPLWFGDGNQQCSYANASDQTAVTRFARWAAAPCRDSYIYTAPVGSFLPNPFGLFDMAGNAWEWTEDCYNGSYEGAPNSGAAWITGSCAERVLRGGSWDNTPLVLRSALRFAQPGDNAVANAGFRLARTLP